MPYRDRCFFLKKKFTFETSNIYHNVANVMSITGHCFIRNYMICIKSFMKLQKYRKNVVRVGIGAGVRLRHRPPMVGGQ